MGGGMVFWQIIWTKTQKILINCAYAAIFLFKEFARINENIILNEDIKKEIEKLVMERLKDKLKKQ